MKLRKGLRRKNMCSNKKPYADANEARTAASYATYKTRERIGSFKCTWCHYFHIGHTPKRIRQLINGRQPE